MAASDTYLIKTAKWTPTGGSQQTLDGIDEVTIRQNGQVVAHGTDGSITIMSHFVDNIEGMVSIRARKGAQFVDTNLQIGTTGSLEITMQKRKAGKGAVSGSDHIVTAANSMIGSSDVGLPGADRSVANLEFHCSDPSGAAVFAFT